MSNPELSSFITELLGSDLWITRLDELKNLKNLLMMKKFLIDF